MDVDEHENEVELRRIPHPYRAVLSICSDLDETPNRHVYWEIMRFLNTLETTSMGPGVGLEVGNTIYFDMPPDQFAYWNTDDAGREMVRALIRSGHIDCLHSYGDLAARREHAGRALEELSKHDCPLEVWVDHGQAPTNFGADIMEGHGDEPGHQAYHADLTCDYGIKYVWRGRVTSVTGQEVPPRVGGVFASHHPVASAKTVAKEAVKRLLARCGSRKYAMHGPNRIMRIDKLRDGRRVYEFLRCNPYWGGVSRAATATGVAEVLTKPFLDRLVEREGMCILYTHLGKIENPDEIFSPPTRKALRFLAEYSQERKILVTTTCHMLRYVAVRDALQYRAERGEDRLVIIIGSIDDPVSGSRAPSFEELAGITFVVPGSDRVEIQSAGGDTVACETTHAGGVSRLMIPWRKLAFPEMGAGRGDRIAVLPDSSAHRSAGRGMVGK